MSVAVPVGVAVGVAVAVAVGVAVGVGVAVRGCGPCPWACQQRSYNDEVKDRWCQCQWLAEPGLRLGLGLGLALDDSQGQAQALPSPMTIENDRRVSRVAETSE